MATGYTPRRKGGSFQRPDIGDAGIRSLRERDQTIIDSLKLSRAQEVERSKERISGQKQVDVIEEGVSDSIENLKQKYFQNRLNAVKKRGRQEGQKGKDQARFLREEGEAAAKKWLAIGKVADAVSAPFMKAWAEDQADQQKSEDYDDYNKAQDDAILNRDTVETDIKSNLAKQQANDDYDYAEEIKKWSTPSIVNKLLANTPEITSQESVGNRASFAQGDIDNHQNFTLTKLIENPDIPVSPKSLKQVFNEVQQQIGQELGFFKEGNWAHHEEVLKWRKAWDIKENELIKTVVHKEAIDANDKLIATSFTRFENNKTSENFYKVARNYTLRPSDKEGQIYMNIKDGYEETVKRLATSKNISKQEALTILSEPWYDNKGTNKHKPNVGGQGLVEKHPDLLELYTKERKAAVQNWDAQLKADKTAQDLADNKIMMRKYLDPKNPYKGGDEILTDIKEQTQKHGKDSTVVTNLKLIYQASKSKWDEGLQQRQLKEAKASADHEFIFEQLNSAGLTGEKRIEFFKTYMPLYGPLKKSGFNPNQHNSQIQGVLAERLGLQSTVKISDQNSETLEAATLHGNILWMEYYEGLTTGDKRRHEPGSAAAKKEAWDMLKAEIAKGDEGDFAILNSSKRKSSGPSEFKHFLTGSGLAELDSGAYQISNVEYQKRVKKLGSEKAAVLSENVFSRDHLLFAYRQVANGMSFDALPFTRNHPSGLTAQQIYQHHFDKLDLPKLKVPLDLQSAVQGDPAYDSSLKRHLQHVRNVSGYWDALAREALGTRPESPQDTSASHNVRSSMENTLRPATTTNTNGTTKTDGLQSFLNSSKLAENLAFASKYEGLDLSTLKRFEGESYYDILEDNDWLAERGIHYGLKYVPGYGHVYMG